MTPSPEQVIQSLSSIQRPRNQVPIIFQAINNNNPALGRVCKSFGGDTITRGTVMVAAKSNTKKYIVYGPDAKRIGSISFDGRVATADEGIGGIQALKTLLAVFPRGFYVKPEEVSALRRFWRRGA